MSPVRRPLAERALAARVRAVPPSGIRRFFDIAATMDDVISLGVGEPDFATPAQVIEAGIASLRAKRTHYTSNYGTIELRTALADHLERRYGDGRRLARRGLGRLGRLGRLDGGLLDLGLRRLGRFGWLGLRRFRLLGGRRFRRGRRR